MQVRDKFYIGGEWVDPAGSGKVEVFSPHDGAHIGTVPEAVPADMDRAVAAARAAFDSGEWSNTSPHDRADLMAKINEGINARIDDFAQTISSENGCPITWGTMGQVLAPSMVLNYFTELTREFAFENRHVGALGLPVVVRREPVGVAAGIIPWNVPLFITMLKMAPTLASGSTLVIKPAPETPLDAYLLAEVLDEAGVPPGVVNIVPAGREVGQHLVTHGDVDKVSFTGSTAAGRKIAALCGEQLKRVTLELGGKSAAIILDDTDLAEAVPQLLPAAMMNNGQACVAQTRILASRDRYDEVVDALVDAIGNLNVGDPLDPATDIGPLVAERQRERVEGYLDIGRDEGAKIAIGGGRPDGLDKGIYVEPTLFVGVDNTMRVAREEIFGPVVGVIPYDDVDDAVAIANDTDYGLSGSVYSADVDTALDVARRVRTGTSTINGFLLDFASPFGGFKDSGIGRELGEDGLEAFLETKSICLPG